MRSHLWLLFYNLFYVAIWFCSFYPMRFLFGVMFLGQFTNFHYKILHFCSVNFIHVLLLCEFFFLSIFCVKNCAIRRSIYMGTFGCFCYVLIYFSTNFFLQLGSHAFIIQPLCALCHFHALCKFHWTSMKSILCLCWVPLVANSTLYCNCSFYHFFFLISNYSLISFDPY